MYLLICERNDIEAVRADIAVEVGVQCGTEILSLEVPPLSLDDLLEAPRIDGRTRITLLVLRRWDHKLVDSIDRNVVLLTRESPVLFLADLEIAERTLAAAPNLRNRLADILVIRPEILGV